MKRQFHLQTLIALSFFVTSASICSVAHAGSEGSGGGHGVVKPDGKITFADLMDNPESVAELQPIDIFTDSRMSQAANEVMMLLKGVQTRYPLFGADLIQTYKQMTWVLSNRPLVPIEDHGFDSQVDIFVQLLSQDENNRVLIDQNRLSQIEPNEELTIKKAMILHELSLAKLGLKTPRQTVVRPLVKAFLNGQADYVAQIAAILDRLDPSTVQGKFRMELNAQVKGYCTGPTAQWYGWLNGYVVLKDNEKWVGRVHRGKIKADFQGYGLSCVDSAKLKLKVNGVDRAVVSMGGDPAGVTTTIVVR